MAFHPNGPVLLAGGGDGTAWMWSLPSGKCLNVFTEDSFPVTRGLFTMDGKCILTSSNNGTVRLWDPKTATVTAKVTVKNESSISSIAVSSDSSYAIIGCEDGSMCLVQLKTMSILREITSVHEASVEGISLIDKDSGTHLSMAASGCLGGLLVIWEVPSMKQRFACSHPCEITKVVSCTLAGSNGPCFATSGTDGCVRVWDAITGQLVHKFSGHQDTILDFVFVEDRFFTASDDQCCLVFSTETN